MIESSGNPVDKSYGMCNKSPMQQHSDTHSEDRGSKAKVKASVNNKEGKRKRAQRRQLRLSVRVCLALFACLTSAQFTGYSRPCISASSSSSPDSAQKRSDLQLTLASRIPHLTHRHSSLASDALLSQPASTLVR
jgi:hypothetical protein